MLILGLTLLLSHALPAPAKAEKREPPPPPPRPCVALRVTAPPGETRRPRFSAGETLDLRISTSFRRRLTGRHRLELKVYTPQGFLYQRFSVPFDASPIPSNRGEVRPPRRSVGVTLPVAGTAITTNSLYGRWKVVPFLDGEATACGLEQRFLIEQ